MLIEHISVSRKSVWDQCALLYKYKYHLKIKPSEPEPMYFVYGKLVHKIAEHFVREKAKVPLREITQDVLNGKIPLEYNKSAPVLPVEYRQRLPNDLRSIYSLTEQIGTEGHLEYEFSYDLDPPNNCFIKGFIDRIIPKNDKWYIIDYKTTKQGKFRKDEQTILDDLQLRMYARVVQKYFNVPAENISCALYYLEGANLVAARYSEQSLERAEKELLYAYKCIKAANPETVQGTTGSHCQRCDYRSMCSLYRQYIQAG